MVISIIAILMAILIPVLRKAKEQGKAIICMSNLRQIGLAANFYAEAYNQFIPRGTGGQQDPTVWYQLFMPFLSVKPPKIPNSNPPKDDYRGVKIYRCPSYPDKEQTVCYVVNDWEFLNTSDYRGDTTEGPAKLTAYKRLSSTIYLCDNENGFWRPIVKEEHDEGWYTSDVWRQKHLPLSDHEIQIHQSEWVGYEWNGPRVAHKRHRQGCNLLFADWHVGYADAKDIAAEIRPGALNKDAINLWRFKK